MGNLLYTDIDQLKMIIATDEFKNTFWNYTWCPVETLKIFRYAAIYDWDNSQIVDGALIAGTKYKRGNMTVYSTDVMKNNIKKLIMTYPMPNLNMFLDKMTLTVNKMSEDKLYAEVTITTVVPDNKKQNFKTYEKTAIFKKQKSLFF